MPMALLWVTAPSGYGTHSIMHKGKESQTTRPLESEEEERLARAENMRILEALESETEPRLENVWDNLIVPAWRLLTGPRLPRGRNG